MATDIYSRAVGEIVKLALEVKPPKGGFTKARDKLDILLAGVEKESDKKKVLKEINDELKKKELNTSYILKGDPVIQHELIHDAFGETMEPDYYWMLDFMREGLGYEMEKSQDFFAASEASGYFSELGGKRTAMESRIAGERGLFVTINFLIKSIINLLYDLKTFDLRLKHYDDLKAKDKDVKKAAMEALKGVWLNEVDKQKGNAAIDILAQQLNFITLRDSFMIIPVHDWYAADADSKKIGDIKEKIVKNVGSMDLTDVVKRILAPRTKEFIDWLYLSDRELRMRQKVEKAYLKAQVNAIKLYTAWARPYLISAQKLIPAECKELQKKHKELGLSPAAIPTPFHALFMYLEIIGAKAAKIEPVKMPGYRREELKLADENNRPNHVVEIRFAFRGTPITVQGAKGERGYGYTGKKVIAFVGFVMQKKHLDLLKEWKDDEVLEFIDAMTKESLDALHDDLHKYLEEEPEVKKKEKPEFEIPFLKWIKETFGSVKKFNTQAKDVYKKLAKVVPSGDAWSLARLTLLAEAKAKKDTFKVYDIFKKQHGMPTPP